MKYFLLDASVLVAYYCKDEAGPVSKEMKKLFVNHSEGKAFLYVPNFCIAEVIRAFAKKCFEEKLYPRPQDTFLQLENTLLEDVVDSKILYSFELSRRHLIYAKQVYKPVYSISYRGASEPPSAFDILLIAAGLDLLKIHKRENLTLLTADEGVKEVCESNRMLFPKTLNLTDERIPTL